ncbi:hypothetical protein KP509_02G006300 [Ceratopteris richardii]|uniref:Xyloglucan endotransglucosylase/hydrolase n=1 Tax=Ceratopteris richardii TaxID=49495 RepID=A0A8T2VAW1_CERRI|nr:hypothetical protein KP509_02G006300 [Ceratopteris richardii]KAH7442893.1 hypothetical protein KP509_02G006300 [Ceratopteris richardii]
MVAMGGHALAVITVAMAAAAILSFPHATAAPNYTRDFDVTWGSDNVAILSNGRGLRIRLDNFTAAGIASKNYYLFGSFSMYMKLIRGDSAGTVTAYYFASSDGDDRDEIDFEFLGNLTGEPYILQTNMYWNGTGGREQRNYLWFDPTKAYHNYSVLWNPQQIIIAVDGVPIRIVKNNEDIGVPYLLRRPMKIYASIWDGSIWATRGGAIKINWGKSPFDAYLAKYNYDVCGIGKNSCVRKKWWNQPQFQTLDANEQSQLQFANTYKVYDYCEDRQRYPVMPIECTRNNL